MGLALPKIELKQPGLVRETGVNRGASPEEGQIEQGKAGVAQTHNAGARSLAAQLRPAVPARPNGNCEKTPLRVISCQKYRST